MKEAWWRRPLRVIQFNFEDRLGLYVPRYRGRDVAELAAKVHANTVVVFARDAFGYTYYRGGRAGPPRPGMRGDFLSELVEEAHRRGIRVVAMVAHTANKLLHMKHSDWGQVNVRGEPILLEHAPAEGAWEGEWPQLCLNSPFIDHAVLEVREAAEAGVDGILLDSFRYQPDPERACYCKWCRERFRREYGQEMPTKPDWSNSLWRTLWDWRYRVTVEAVARLVEEARSRGLPVFYNSHPAGWAGRANRVVELARDIIDGVFAECSEVDYEPPGFIAEMVKLSRAMAGGRAKVFASRNAFHYLMPPTPAPPAVVRQGLREAIVAGGDPWVLFFPSTLESAGPELLKAVETVFREHEILEEFIVGAEPVRYAAVVVSNVVRDHYGRLEPGRYVAETRGFYYAFTHSHVPVDYLLDRDIPEKHSLYKLVVLANTACIGNGVVDALNRRGRGIIATFETGMYDSGCLPAGGLMLSELLGVEPTGETIELEWAYADFRGGSLPFNLVPLGAVPRNLGKRLKLASILPVKPIDGAKPVGRMRLAAYRYGHEYTLGRSQPPAGPTLDTPALILGEGTIYIPWQLGANYWVTGLPVHRRLAVWAAEHIADPPPVKADAPETLHVEAWRQSGRLIIHLLNHTYTVVAPTPPEHGGARQPLPAYSLTPAATPRTRVVPVHGVTVHVNLDEAGLEGSSLRAYNPLTGKDYGVAVAGSTAVISVPVVEEYMPLVLEAKD